MRYGKVKKLRMNGVLLKNATKYWIVADLDEGSVICETASDENADLVCDLLNSRGTDETISSVDVGDVRFSETAMAELATDRGGKFKPSRERLEQISSDCVKALNAPHGATHISEAGRYYKNDDAGLQMVWVEHEGINNGWQYTAHKAIEKRGIVLTPIQSAADRERNESISKIMRDVKSCTLPQAIAIYDAGYRKVEK